jgi:hypothetical protein
MKSAGEKKKSLNSNRRCSDFSWIYKLIRTALFSSHGPLISDIYLVDYYFRMVIMLGIRSISFSKLWIKHR